MDEDRVVWQVARPVSRLPLVGLTVLIHVLMAWVFLMDTSVLSNLPAAPVTRMTWVDLPALEPKSEPVEPPPQPAPTPEKAKPVKAKPSKIKPERQRVPEPARTAAPAIILTDAPAAPTDAAPDESVFNRDAALATARALANERPRRLAGSGLPEPAAPEALLETETDKLGRTIANGKRQSCIGPNAKGNLLTPLGWLLQKKGSGCKF